MDMDLLRAGSRLAGIMPSGKAAESAIMRLGTIKSVQDANGYLTADVNIGGGTLQGVQMTVDCAKAKQGDRCVVETFAHLSIVTGILARPGASR